MKPTSHPILGLNLLVLALAGSVLTQAGSAQPGRPSTATPASPALPTTVTPGPPPAAPATARSSLPVDVAERFAPVTALIGVVALSALIVLTIQLRRRISGS